MHEEGREDREDGPDRGPPPDSSSSEGADDSMSAWDYLKEQEPFATFRAEPKRFWIGLPAVFIGGALVGALLVGQNMALALIAQFCLQALGFIWLYVPALRRRREGE